MGGHSESFGELASAAERPGETGGETVAGAVGVGDLVVRDRLGAPLEALAASELGVTAVAPERRDDDTRRGLEPSRLVALAAIAPASHQHIDRDTAAAQNVECARGGDEHPPLASALEGRAVAGGEVDGRSRQALPRQRFRSRRAETRSEHGDRALATLFQEDQRPPLRQTLLAREHRHAEPAEPWRMRRRRGSFCLAREHRHAEPAEPLPGASAELVVAEGGEKERVAGETRKLEIPEAEHQNVRTAAHQWSVKNGAKLACNKIDSRTIAVTRLDPNAPDLALARAHAKRLANGRGMRFPFDALQAVGQSFFVPLHEDPTGSALRALARYYAARLGAKFKVTYTGEDVPPAQRGYYVLRIA